MCPSCRPLKSHPRGQYLRLALMRSSLRAHSSAGSEISYTHQFSKPTENRKKNPGKETEKKSMCPAPAPPRTHPSTLSQSQPDLVSQASTMGNGLLGSFMPHSYKRPLEYPNLSVYYKVPFPCRPPRPSFLGVIQASCQILSNCISLTLTV